MMNVPLRLGRSIAGVSIIGLAIAGISHLPISNSQQVKRTGQSPRLAIELPVVTPIVSSELASDRFRQVDAPSMDLISTTVGKAVQKEQPTQLNSDRSTLEEAQVAVAFSQTQLAQARINLIEFQAKHDTAKILSAQGKVSRQQAATARAAYKLAQLQHRSAEIGLQGSQAQLIAARAEVSKLGCKANAVSKM